MTKRWFPALPLSLLPQTGYGHTRAAQGDPPAPAEEPAAEEEAPQERGHGAAVHEVSREYVFTSRAAETVPPVWRVILKRADAVAGGAARHGLTPPSRGRQTTSSKRPAWARVSRDPPRRSAISRIPARPKPWEALSVLVVASSGASSPA